MENNHNVNATTREKEEEGEPGNFRSYVEAREEELGEEEEEDVGGGERRRRRRRFRGRLTENNHQDKTMKVSVKTGILTAVPETYEDMVAIVKFAEGAREIPENSVPRTTRKASGGKGRPSGSKDIVKRSRSVHCRWCSKLLRNNRGRGIHERRKHGILGRIARKKNVVFREPGEPRPEE